MRFAVGDPLSVASTERLLENRVGGIRSVAAGDDGAIYVATASSLLHLAPVTASAASGTGRLGIVR